MWDNGRAEKAYIAKRIDRFIVHVSIIDKLGMPFSTVGNAFVSNHRPILLSWREKGFRKGYPFKFNRTCLEDPAFNDFITKAWKDLSTKAMSPSFLNFRDKMAAVRKLVKEWQIEKRKKDRQAIQDTQQELDSILKSTDANSCPFSMKCHIRELERKKYILLKQEESYWRLKSREIWLKEGDRNTKFFHKYANTRREKNTIWKISDGNGGFFVSQQDISREAVSHFKSQYRRRDDGAFQDILWVIDLVPQMFDDEKNESLFQPVTENELLGILKPFKKDKCPGLDGWTIEFFTHFFDTIKQYLLRMVETSKMTGSIHHITTSTLIALIPKKVDAESFHDFRPISLCNISFKIITKIIAERIKATLASFLTKDQHAFLKGQNILDVVA